MIRQCLTPLIKISLPVSPNLHLLPVAHYNKATGTVTLTGPSSYPSPSFHHRTELSAHHRTRPASAPSRIKHASLLCHLLANKAPPVGLRSRSVSVRCERVFTIPWPSDALHGSEVAARKRCHALCVVPEFVRWKAETLRKGDRRSSEV